MGVTGLWTVVQPCARPIKLETLNKRRLAVDASIWIYQFLKAVRDKEGNALRNSHIVGFFRRICKLLYFGIKPVFVFDGGAPILKRQTIANRQKRREGRREDAARTAGKLLAVHLQRSAEEEAARQRSNVRAEEEEEVPDNPVYADDAFRTDREKQQARQFKRKDAYHLPDLDISLEQMGAPNDPRIMSQEELEEYAQQFYRGDDINLYDFSKIDFDSPFFMSLPATDRYNILNAARLRSRLRMGYSKEQLENMFPDRMAFSKFQIERVKERNDLTQRLMNINGMNGEDAFLGLSSGQRVAGERGKEYVLVKDAEVEGGWVLGVVGNKDEGRAENPIDVDEYGKQDIIFPDVEVSDDEGGFEDVPIEGLNRLPKLPFLREGVFDDSINTHELEAEPEDDSLFVKGDQGQHRDIDDIFEDKEPEDEDLQKAIAMSLETTTEDKHDHDLPEISINRSDAASAPSKEIGPILMPESDEDDDMDLAAALAQSKRPKREPNHHKAYPMPNNPFEGPLPFESIKLKKPSDQEKSKSKAVDDNAGGFVKEPTPPTKDQLPLPPWFSSEQTSAEFITDETNDSLENYRDTVMTPKHQSLRDYRSPGVINVDRMPDSKEVIDLEDLSEEDESGKLSINEEAAIDGPIQRPEKAETLIVPEDDAVKEKQYKLDTTDKQSISNFQENIARTELSPSPEFEDVTIQPEEKAPVTINADFEPGLSTEVNDQDLLVSVEDEAGNMTDPEEEDLIRQIAEEGEEHARFAATLNTKSQAQNAVDYDQELKELRFQQKRDRRDADEVSQVMISECQQLLTLFGLPYITAPMEAEAQCAELVSLGLVDGIITDDSDIFLFGGTCVYKNMFNQSKFVECYLTSDMEKEYVLHRKKLISFAHLLGSDYTEGIPGIGPVTALEILTEFSSLEEFSDWWTQVQTGVDMFSEGNHPAFYKKFRKNASKIFLPPSFPDARVEQAYFQPEVDSDPSIFQWGVPDLHGLRNFLMATIGWSQERTDEILVPVIRDMNQREQEGTQSNITNFYNGPQGAGAFAPRVRTGGKSRMEKAFSRLRQEAATSGKSADEDGVTEVDSALGNRLPSESNEVPPEENGKKGKRSKNTASAPRVEYESTIKKRKTKRGANG